MRCLKMRTLAIAATFAALAPLTAMAQPPQVSCAGLVTPLGALKFDSDEHKAWYVRFWTGDCSGTHSFCMPGSPNWMTSVAYVVAHAKPAQRNDLVARTCRLGQRVGFEWARAPKLKRIGVGDLRGFGDLMRKSPDLSLALDQINARVAVLLAKPRSGS